MTSRELVYATLEFRNTENRAPRELWSLEWAKMFQKDDYERIVKKYTWDIAEPKVIYKESSPVESGDPCKKGESTDAWGCKFKNIHDGIIGEVKEPIVTDDEWNDTSRVVFPENWLSFDIEQIEGSNTITKVGFHLFCSHFPTLRTEKDIGSKTPETIAVSGVFLSLFKVEFKRYHFSKTTLGEDLNKNGTSI